MPVVNLSDVVLIFAFFQICQHDRLALQAIPEKYEFPESAGEILVAHTAANGLRAIFLKESIRGSQQRGYSLFADVRH